MRKHFCTICNGFFFGKFFSDPCYSYAYSYNSVFVSRAQRPPIRPINLEISMFHWHYLKLFRQSFSRPLILYRYYCE